MARSKFRKGQRVKMSPLGYQSLQPGKIQHGVVVGFCNDSALVRIRLNNERTASSYHHSFWSVRSSHAQV